MTDDEDEKRKLRERFKKSLENPHARRKLRQIALAQFGALLEARKETPPTLADNLSVIIEANRPGDAGHIARGRLAARMAKMATEKFSPPPPPAPLRTRLRAWLYRKLRRTP